MPDINVKLFSWVSFFWFLHACPVFGQAAKTVLTEQDYSRFGVLRNEAISDTGKWLAYSMSYESGLDTLFVSCTDGSRRTAIEKAHDARFVGERLFCALSNGNAFHAVDLKTSRHWSVPNIIRYEITSDRQHIALISDSEKNRALQIFALNGRLIKRIDGVGSFEFDNSFGKIAYERTGKVVSAEICELTGKLENAVVATAAVHFGNFAWQRNAKSLSFVRDDGSSVSIDYYDMRKRLLLHAPALANDRKVSVPSNEFLRVSEDGKSVFFTLASPQNPPDDFGTPEIWNAADHNLYSLRKTYGESTLFWVKWDVVRNVLSDISTQALPAVSFTADLRYALCFNGREYGPRLTKYPLTDYYVMNVSTGERVLIAKKIADPGDIAASPSSALIAYKIADDWTVFDPDANKKFALPLSQGLEFVGWASDSKSLVFTDGQDIWQIDARGKTANRLTEGKQRQLFYAIADNATLVDSKKMLLEVHTADYSHSGYALIQDGKYRELMFDNSKISGMLLSTDNETFSYVTQRFDMPGILECRRNKLRIKAYKSNRFVSQYNWGKSEPVNFDVNGQQLHGALFYPMNFDAAKRYPMVVHLYEQQSTHLHEFVCPTLDEGVGFNISVLASQGYFVFLPDIAYRIGDPGLSAVECVRSAVQAACSNRAIDTGRIGLFGHSFGGWETSFIITQSDVFRCAIAGSEITDQISSYFAQQGDLLCSEYFRCEHEQRRIGSMFYDDKDRYLRNSPIFYADKIKTPLLQFTGDSDTNVPTIQSFELYFALRRLQKENILLVYRGENHILRQKKNKRDLTLKVLDWFDYYLKDGEKRDWMLPR